jgi:hypothetical protein
MSASQEHDAQSISTANKLARNITTKFFGGKTIAFKRVRKGPGIDWLGQIVGHVFNAKDKMALDNEGKEMHSIELLGDFEAVNYRTGEVCVAPTAYLPNYFAKHTKAAIEAAGKPVLFSVELGVEALREDQIRGGIAYTWVVKNLLPQRQSDNPLNALKMQMHRAGMLRLPLPTEEAHQIEQAEEAHQIEQADTDDKIAASVDKETAPSSAKSTKKAA